MKRIICTLAAFALFFGSLGFTSHAESKSNSINFISINDAQDYYSDAVFIGDSVGGGFKLYVESNDDSIAKNICFLTSKGFGIFNALRPLDDGVPHPEYNGQKQLVWDSIQQIGAKKVFLSLGMNDLNTLGNRFISKYKELIDKILEVNPDVEITVISITPVFLGAESGRINNETISEMNKEIKCMAVQNCWNYIDIHSLLVNDDGGLKKEYCSDSFVHLTRSAYSHVWESIFKSYAKKRISTSNNIWIEDMTGTIVTTEECEVYEIPRFRSEPLLNAPADLEIVITGCTDNGFYRVDLGTEEEYYIPKAKALIKE